jgi:hypothetical protein
MILARCGSNSERAGLIVAFGPKAKSGHWVWALAVSQVSADEHRAGASHRPMHQKAETMTFNYFCFAG